MQIKNNTFDIAGLLEIENLGSYQTGQKMIIRSLRSHNVSYHGTLYHAK